jgi:hypothetical protein
MRSALMDSATSLTIGCGTHATAMHQRIAQPGTVQLTYAQSTHAACNKYSKHVTASPLHCRGTTNSPQNHGVCRKAHNISQRNRCTCRKTWSSVCSGNCTDETNTLVCLETFPWHSYTRNKPRNTMDDMGSQALQQLRLSSQGPQQRTHLLHPGSTWGCLGRPSS